MRPELPRELDGFALGTAAREFGRRVAAWTCAAPAADADAARALAGAACLALLRREQGHAFLDFEAPVLLSAPDPEAPGAPDTVAFDGHRAWLQAVARAGVRVDAPRPGDPLVLEGARLYVRSLWEDERALAAWLRERAGAPVHDEPHASWMEPLLRALFAADAPSEQLQAVRRSLARRLSVVTGGPGTGKTYVVARMLLAQGVAHMLTRARPPAVALLAPTGKAARRVDESVAAAVEVLRAPVERLAAEWAAAPPAPGAAHALLAALQMVERLRGGATTLHAALESSPHGGARFQRGATRPLDADMVVVDEASMVALAHMRALCSAVAPHATLVLLGDRAQLQSVEAGSVLADIEGSPAALVAVCTRLAGSRRFPESSGLGRLAAAMRDGAADAAGEPLALALLERDAEVRAQVVLVEPPQGGTTARAVAMAVPHAEALQERGTTPAERLARLGAFALLCGHRRGVGGADEINERLRRRMAPAGTVEGAPFDGMPIVVLRNSPDASVANGDCGVVCADGGGVLRAHFDGGRAVRVEMLPEFAPAYALTVHKSQGSEFGSVALVLPERESPVLTRELVYTALTRWKAGAGGVTILARQPVLAAALRSAVQRASGLVERLRGPS